jgi:glycosyltransferase involved in cell wall biosynthesis
VKILYLSSDPGIPFWGSKGASIHVREFTRALKAAGHELHIGVARLGRPPADAEKIWEIPGPDADFFQCEQKWGEPKLLAEAAAFARNFYLVLPPTRGFDLVYERYSLFGIAGLSIARRLGIPLVLEVNSPLVEEEKAHRTLILEPLARAIERYLFSQADGIIAVSESIRSYICSISAEARLAVLPNGVDADLFLKAQGTESLRAKLGGERFLVGFVGSLKPWHGLEVLLQAFRWLPGEQHFHLVLVGDGPLRQPLEREVEQLNLKDRVTFTGAVDYQEIPGILKGLDVTVAPYPPIADFYFSPIKIFEYMASGRPIVASRIGQVAEILEDGRTALLVPPGDAEALGHALLRLRSNRELGERLGSVAQVEVQKAHTWARRVETIEPFLTALVQRSRQLASMKTGAAERL